MLFINSYFYKSYSICFQTNKKSLQRGISQTVTSMDLLKKTQSVKKLIVRKAHFSSKACRFGI